jgi:hypothetical protein
VTKTCFLKRSGPASRSKFREPLDSNIGEARKDRCQTVAHGNSQPSTAFPHREYRCDLRSRLLAADVDPITAKSHGTD